MRIHARTSAAALLFVPLASALWDCIAVIEKHKFDFTSLGEKIHEVIDSRETPPTITNMTWQISPCHAIGKKKQPSCPNGAQVCGIERIYVNETDTWDVHEIIPVAGDISYGHGEYTTTRLKTSDSHSDHDKEGVRLKMTGGKYGNYKQQAIVEFVCDPDRTGLEGNPEEDLGDYKPDEKKRLARREGDSEVSGDEEERDGNKGMSLKYEGYETIEEQKLQTLRLTWLTKYACENLDKGESGDKSAHWGFFTWFIIILFLGVAAYLIFGSWLNYNRYGARGWDLLPHSDTIRDMPYLLKDWGRRVFSSLQAGGSRGSYSAL